MGQPDLVGIARAVLGVPDKAAHALVLRDLDGWLRLQWLGAMARSGLADALPCRADGEVAEALLDLGVSLGELRRGRDGRYSAKGRRLKAVVDAAPFSSRSPASTASGRDEKVGAVGLRGLVEELVSYDSPIYAALPSHLAGGPPGPYLDGLADVIARASRLAEPVLAPVVASVVSRLRPASVLDVGCGTGAYVRVAASAGAGSVVGIDLDPAPFAAAPDLDLRQADLFALPPELAGPHDLAMLLQNIYYWPPEERVGVLRRLGEVGRSVLVASAVPAGPPLNRHLDLVLRVTAGNWRLPTKDELAADMAAAGFGDVAVREPVPRSGFVVATGRAP